MCGGTAEPLALLDGRGELPQFPADAGKPELEWAFEAWARGEHARVVSHCLSAEGAQGVKNRTVREGPAFVALLGGISVVIQIDSGAGLMTIETPVARLPQTQYVGAMRLALELSAGTRSAARYAVRAETLFLRMVGRLDTMSPAVVQSALKAIVTQAIDDAKVLSTSVHARVIPLKEHIDIDLEALPEAHHLDLGSVHPPDPGSKATMPAEADFSMMNMPPLGAPKPAPTMVSAPAGGGAAGARISSLRPPPARMPTSPAPQTTRADTARSGGAGASAGATEAPLRVPTSRTAQEKPTPFRPLPAVSKEPSVPAPAPAASGSIEDGRSAPATAEDALSELLHKAQTLGAVLSFADQPATTALLIRATVYRVVLGYDDSLPNATSRLFADAAPLTKEIYITAPGIRRGAMAIPSANDAFDSMRKIVDSRCVVEAGPAVQVTPITSSQDAKQHLARYVSEIDQAPKDLEVRHFLALGALSELLVRAKLPGPTLERLRGIIAHAERDGAKQAVVDLMMTALTRMMA